MDSILHSPCACTCSRVLAVAGGVLLHLFGNSARSFDVSRLIRGIPAVAAADGGGVADSNLWCRRCVGHQQAHVSAPHLQEDAAAFQQWQRQMAVDRSRGHFFKSLYQAELDEEEDDAAGQPRRKVLPSDHSDTICCDTNSCEWGRRSTSLCQYRDRRRGGCRRASALQRMFLMSADMQKDIQLKLGYGWSFFNSLYQAKLRMEDDAAGQPHPQALLYPSYPICHQT